VSFLYSFLILSFYHYLDTALHVRTRNVLALDDASEDAVECAL
jgi:hypothetical protein